MPADDTGCPHPAPTKKPWKLPSTVTRARRFPQLWRAVWRLGKSLQIAYFAASGQVG
jgi:hypothetical protein